MLVDDRWINMNKTGFRIPPAPPLFIQINPTEYTG